jgi:hypothetical protein
MITPGVSCSRKLRIASRAHRKEPRRLTASTLSKSAAERSSEGREIWMPALLIRTSIPPSWSTASASMRTTSSSSETSPWRSTSRTPSWRTSRRRPGPAPPFRRPPRRCAGRDRDVRAVLCEPHRDRPADPDVPPVTSTFLPFSPRMPSLAVAGSMIVICRLLGRAFRPDLVLETVGPLQVRREQHRGVGRLGPRRGGEPARGSARGGVPPAAGACGGDGDLVRRRRAAGRGRARARPRGGRRGGRVADGARAARRHARLRRRRRLADA